MTTNYYGSDAIATGARVALRTASTIADLQDLGIERGFTLWPEWGPTFTDLDKRTENRPAPPPKNLIGKRVAFHAGTYVGGRKGNEAHKEGLASMLAAAKMSGWSALGQHAPGCASWVVLRKGDQTVILDSRWNPVTMPRPTHPALREAVGIPLAAITFTAIITGYEMPTREPTRPWQFASDPDSRTDRSYGWHVAEIVRLDKPIPCSGLQGFWPLRIALQPRRRR